MASERTNCFSVSCLIPAGSVVLALALGLGDGHVLAASPTGAASAVTAWGRPGKGKAWGYLGDGSGNMDAKPPLRFDGQKPVWKTPMPTFGFACPIVVGDRVLVTCEPNASCAWPRLMCLSDKDGTLLWSAELNHLPAVEGLSTAQQAEANKLWANVWRCGPLLAQATKEHQNTPEAEVPGLIKKMEALGCNFTGGIGKPLSMGDLNTLGSKYGPYGKIGFTLDTWRGSTGATSYMVGEAFPTPTTDGENVYAVNVYGGFFCFSLDGKLKWVKHYPGQPGEYCRNGRSPIIYKDLLLCDTTARMRAIDRKTGRLLWSAPVEGSCYLTPAVVSTKGGDIVLCGHGEAFGLPDGKKLTSSTPLHFGCVALTKYDEPDVAIFQGGDEHGGWPKEGPQPPQITRFLREGDTLKATNLMNGTGYGCQNQSGVAYHAGKIYHIGLGVVDAKTGQVLLRGAGKNSAWPASVPKSRHLLLVADGHVFGLRAQTPDREGRGTTQLHFDVSAIDGKPVATSTVPGHYTYSCPFALSGTRVYIRSQTMLLCFDSNGNP